jgi:Uma2 family endonuclease
MTAPLTLPATPPRPQQKELDADAFRYGWRYVNVRRQDGSVDVLQVPLTLEDVLHPQEDDVIPERPVHEMERGDLARIFRTRLPRLHNGLVLCDCIINWGVPGVRNHSPDVSVFDELRQQPDLNIGTFYLALFGGHCLLALEIVSPHTRSNDVERKLEEYFQARIPLYIIVDQKSEGAPRELRAYCLGAQQYEPIPLDDQGRVALPFLGLLLGLRDERVVCYDADTGQELGDYVQVTEQKAAAEQRVQQAESRAEHEAAARRVAEEQAQYEAQARQALEQQLAADAARLREVEAELRRLRGESP